MVLDYRPFKNPNKYVWFFNGQLLVCPVTAETDHLNTRLVWYAEGHCTVNIQILDKSGFGTVYFSLNQYLKIGPFKN